jgi:hypothetical protein
LPRIISEPSRAGFRLGSPNYKHISRAHIIPNTPQRVKLIKEGIFQNEASHDMLEDSFPHNVTIEDALVQYKVSYLTF